MSQSQKLNVPFGQLFKAPGTNPFSQPKSNLFATVQKQANDSILTQSTSKSPNILVSDKQIDEQSLFEQFDKQLNISNAKTFKKDSYHLVEEDSDNKNITTHLELKNKPNSDRRPSIIKVVTDDIIYSEPDEKIISVEDLKEDTQKQLLFFFKGQQNLEINQTEIQKKVINHRLSQYKMKIKKQIQINQQYQNKIQQLKSEIGHLNNKLFKIDQQESQNTLNSFSVSQNQNSVSIGFLLSELSKYRGIMQIQKLENLKALNQVYENTRASNKSMVELAEDLRARSLMKQDIQVKEKQEDQKQYEQRMQQLWGQINIQKKKYDRLKARGRSDLRLQRLSNSSVESLDVRVHEIYSYRNLIVLMVFIMGLIGALGFRYYY